MKSNPLNLTKIYIQYLCYIYNTTLPKLSIKLGHKQNWLSSDIFNRNSTISKKYYKKCLKILAREFSITPNTLHILTQNNLKSFHPIMSNIYSHITTRHDLIGYINLLLSIHNESFTTLARRIHRGDNYFRNGLIHKKAGRPYRDLLIILADSMQMPRQHFIKFSNLPNVRHNNIGRKKINKFLICYAQACGTTLKDIFKNDIKYIRFSIKFGSTETFHKCLVKISHQLYIPMSTFKMVLNDNTLAYQAIKQTALNHVHDRRSLEQCIRCLATCNDTSLQNIGHEYGYAKDRIIACISRNYYKQINKLLMNIRLSLSINTKYIERAMKQSHIPKRYGINGSYDNLIAYLQCYGRLKHTTITKMSQKMFSGNKNKLTELMGKDFSELNHRIIEKISTIGIPKDDIIRIIHGNDLPLNNLVNEMKQRVHDRNSLIDYIHCVVYQHHTSFIILNKRLQRPASYMSGTLSTGYYEVISKLFKKIARFMGMSTIPLFEALHKSKILNAVHLIPTTHRQRTTLDMTSRRHIKACLYNLIRKHNIFPSKLNFILHPKATSSSLLSGRLLHCSRDTLISESALILNYLHESPKSLKIALNQNKMGEYYPLLLQKCHHLKKIENTRKD